VTVTDAKVADAAVADAAVLEVTDHGRGIHPADLEKIFDVGYRGRFAANGEDGSGIGLASARELIAEQGGAIVVDSRVGAGTTVRVELPLARFGAAA
jgi:signal transduction histidine kinase